MTEVVPTKRSCPIGAGLEPGGGPGVVRVVGIEFWPAGAGRPTGPYEPVTSGTGRSLPFMWRTYSPGEKARRLQESERAREVIHTSALTRAVTRLFRGTPIPVWLVRRNLRNARRRSHKKE